MGGLTNFLRVISFLEDFFCVMSTPKCEFKESPIS